MRDMICTSSQTHTGTAQAGRRPVQRAQVRIQEMARRGAGTLRPKSHVGLSSLGIYSPCLQFLLLGAGVRRGVLYETEARSRQQGGVICTPGSTNGPIFIISKAKSLDHLR